MTNIVFFFVYFGPKCGRKVAVMKDLVAVKGPKMAVVWVEVAVKACWDLATLATASANNICIDAIPEIKH